jgi:hypothetical protein
VGNKTKDRASLERSERRGFCFVGNRVLICQLPGILPVVPEEKQLQFFFSWLYPVIQGIVLGDKTLSDVLLFPGLFEHPRILLNLI